MIKWNPKDDTPEKWGPDYWKYLHTHAKNSDYSSKWLEEFTNAIPCPKCKRHFQEIPKPNKTIDFFTWSVVTHNIINKRLGKKIMSMKEANDLY